MTKQSVEVAHPELVGGGQTSLHSHAGGGGGLVDKGGEVTTGGNGEASVSFNSNYSNTSYFVSLTPVGSSLSACIVSGSKAVGGFTLVVCNDRGQTQSGIVVTWSTGPYNNP